MTDEYDVVVVGGSLAGCTAATLFARRGWRVAVVEKDPSLDAYKVICGHYIQAGAVPTMERLGVMSAVKNAGAVPTQVDYWTPFGWVRTPDRGRRSWSLRRSALDPLVRMHAIETRGVEYLPGLAAVGLVGHDRINGVRVSGPGQPDRVLKARLVIAADGRGSRMAKLAHVRARVKASERFSYFTYFKNVPLPDPHKALVWWTDPDLAALFPNEDGVTVAGVFIERRQLAKFRRDPDAAVRARFRTLPGAPDLDSAQRVSRWLGRTKMPNAIRPATARGMAFIGDAAQASDPIWGVGCGWAFQSADWLDQEVGWALDKPDHVLDGALRGYARRHLRELGAHHFFISDYSSGRPFSPIERFVLSTATRDPELASRIDDYNTRSVRGLTGARRVITRAAMARVGMALGR